MGTTSALLLPHSTGTGIKQATAKTKAGVRVAILKLKQLVRCFGLSSVLLQWMNDLEHTFPLSLDNHLCMCHVCISVCGCIHMSIQHECSTQRCPLCFLRPGLLLTWLVQLLTSEPASPRDPLCRPCFPSHVCPSQLHMIVGDGFATPLHTRELATKQAAQF